MRKVICQAISGAQLGFWHFGNSSFEIHKDLGTVLYSASDLKSLEDVAAAKRSRNPTVTSVKAIQEAVHKLMKNWCQSMVVPHYQVRLHIIQFKV